jgi:hypothetical protein
MALKMTEKGLFPPNGIKYPIWAWFQWSSEKHRKPDLRCSGFGNKGEKMVRLTIDVNDKEVFFQILTMASCIK